MKVAIYTRVSTNEQAKEGTSLEVQRQSLESFIKREESQKAGWEIYYPRPGEIYEDDGYSGYSMERPALKRLLEDAKKKKFDLILVHKIDRFSRKLKDLLNLVDELEDYEVHLKSSTEFYDTTSSSGKMMFQQLGSFAEFERNRIKERVFPGMLKGVERGNWQGARYSPYGYSYNPDEPEKKLRVIKDESDIVKMMYTMYLSGQSTPQIAGYLYNKGYKTRSGGLFHTKLVGDILKNQIYIGNIIWNRHHYDMKQKTLKGYKYIKNDPSKFAIGKGKHEAIISQEDFDAVQKKLESNRKGLIVRKGSKEYPLTGILVCGNEKCMHKMNGQINIASRRDKGKKRRYYRCTGKGTHNVNCHEPAARADDIESEIFTILDITLSSKQFDEKRIEQIVQLAGSVHNAELEQEIAAVKAEIEKNIVKQGRLSQIFTDGLLAIEAYKKQVVPLRDEERELKVRHQRLKLNLIEKEKSEEYQKLLKAVVNHFDYVLDNLDLAGKKGLMRLVFKIIVIKDGKIKSFEMFQPFQSMYEGAWLQWQTQMNREESITPVGVCGSKPTAAK